MADRSSKRCALRRMARARCPRPQGPVDGCRARRPLVPCRKAALPFGGKAFCLPWRTQARPTRCDLKEVRLSAHREGRMRSLPRAPACSCNGDGAPGGEGILPSHAPLGARGQSIFEAMRLAAHSEGKMPSPPGGRPMAVGLADPVVPFCCAACQRALVRVRWRCLPPTEKSADAFLDSPQGGSDLRSEILPSPAVLAA